ncbi:MAG TPA: hypothetical protein EYN06_02205 [Myxococcales bacterium]|nr:hypothetical protein [Myxococcales bacterium]
MKRLIFWLILILISLLSACVEDVNSTLGHSGLALTEGELNAKVLELLNHESTTLDVLDLDAQLTKTAAVSLIGHRNGPDGVFGSADDNLFDSIQEVDDVKYVGASTLGKLKAFASTWTAPIPGQETDPVELQVLNMLNHSSTTVALLDIDAALTSTAANNLIAHRDGVDATFGTADDDLYDSISEVDAISGIGPQSLIKIVNFAASWVPPEDIVPGNNPDQQVLDMLNHVTTTLTILDINAALTVTAAKKIMEHRDGIDGEYGTADDDLFDSIKELDDVKYVGQSAVNKIVAYAAGWTPETNTVGGPIDVPQVLQFLNHITTTRKTLKNDCGVTSTQSNNIISHRNGPDDVLGSADDDLFDNIDELDSVSYIGPKTIDKLQAFASAWIPLDPAKVLEQKVIDFLNHETTTESLLDTKVGLTSTAAKYLIEHRNGVDGKYGTADDDPFDSLQEVDDVKYVGESALTKIKDYAENFDPDTAIAEAEEAAKDTPLSCSNCGIFAGNPLEYDAGPPAGSGWAELFAAVPNFRTIAKAWGETWLIPDINGLTKFDKVNAELVAAEEDPIKLYTLTKNKFRYHMGPLFYRGRLDGTARVLVVGQEGATDEAIVHRAFVGGTGQKVQNFLNSLGITKSYIFLNTFVYSIYEQYDEFTRELATQTAIKDHRNQILKKIFDESNIELVLTFGAAAHESVKLFREEIYAGKFPTGTRWSHALHPGAAAMAYAPDSTGTVIDSASLNNVVKSFSESWKRVWYWRYIDPGWCSPDADGWQFQSSKYYFGDRDIPYRDLPFGASHQLGRGGTKTERAKSGLQVQLRSSNGIRYEAPSAPFPSTVAKSLSAFEKSQPDEVSWEPPKFNPDTRHDAGPPADWVEFLYQTPAQTVIQTESGIDTNNDFHQVPLWYRGQLDNNVPILVLAQDYGIDQIVAGRVLVGDAGQKINHLLENLGVGSNYLMLNPYPYPLNDTVPDHEVLDLAMSLSLSAYRKELLEKVLAENDIKLVITFGEIAENAYQPVSTGNNAYWVKLAHPDEAAASVSWNGGMNILSGTALGIDMNGPFIPYTMGGFADIRAMIPREDLPWGMPLWFGTSGDVSEQPNKSWIFWNAPQWVGKEGAEG